MPQPRNKSILAICIADFAIQARRLQARTISAISSRVLPNLCTCWTLPTQHLPHQPTSKFPTTRKVRLTSAHSQTSRQAPRRGRSGVAATENLFPVACAMSSPVRQLRQVAPERETVRERVSERADTSYTHEVFDHAYLLCDL